MVDERVDADQPFLGILGDDLGPGLACGGCQRRLHEPELRRAVIGDDEEPVAVRCPGVFAGVLDALPSGFDAPRGGSRIVCVDHPLLAAARLLRGDDDHVTAPAAADIDREPLVGLSEYELVLIGRGPEDMPPHLVGPVGVVGHGVEEARRVRTPCAAVVGARQQVGKVGAGVEVSEPQDVDLVAGDVRRVRQQPLVRAHQGQPEVEIW